MIIAMVIVGIIGAAFTRVLTSQTRFYDREAAQRSARSVARGATNVMLADLRMVQDSGGVDSVAADGRSIRILIPYRFGLVCGTTGNKTTVSMLPTDSATVAYSVYRGFAWRNPATGRYTYVTPDSGDVPVVSGTPSLCTGNANGQAQIRTVSANGRAGNILELKGPNPSGAPVGAPVFLWQRITYSFRTSAAYPNRLALWRNVHGGVNEEIMAPFDTATRFRFYKEGDDASSATPPLVSEIRGLDLVLVAVSPRATAGNASISTARLSTSVFFKNVRAF